MNSSGVRRRRFGEHLDRLRQQPAVVQELEAVQRDDPNGPSGSARTAARLRRRAPGCRESCSSRCRRPRRRGDSPRPTRPVHSGCRQRRRELPVELLRERVAEVEAAQATLDVRDRYAQCAPDHAPSTVVIVSPWTSTSGFRDPRRARRTAALLQRGAVTRREPAGDVGVHAEVAPARAAREPEVGLPEAELLQEAGNLLDLLTRRREHVAMPRSSSRRSTGASLISSPVVPKTTRITAAARTAAPHSEPVPSRIDRRHRCEDRDLACDLPARSPRRQR